MIDIAMFGSLVFTPLLFLLMPVRRALVMSYCLLWMFLPVASIWLPGMPMLTKPAAISVGVFIAMVLFYADLIIQRFRLRWFDIPVLIFGLVAPFVSALFNDLGLNSAIYEMIQGLFLWVVPYFAGRIILGDELGVHEVAMGIFFAALIYAPFAWFEMFFSPQLHKMVYGAHQHKFAQTVRGWSYRPVVFMSHGLMTSMWLVAGAVCGAWLLKHKRLRWKLPIQPKYAVFFMLGTAALANSMGALLLLIVSLIVLFMGRLVKPQWVLVPLLAVAPIYIVTRSTGAIEGESLVSIIEPINEFRAASLRYRLMSEDAYVARAWEQPVLGWGGHGRHRPISDETGQEIGASDGLWIIVFGKTGVIGLVFMNLALLLVPFLAIMTHSTRIWRHPRFAASGVLVVLMCIYTIDNLFNAMVNPVYMLAAGALAGFVTQPLGSRFAVSRRQASAQKPDPHPREHDRPVGLAT